MVKPNYQAIMQKIAKQYGIKVLRIKRGDRYCKANGTAKYLNHSWSCGSIHCVDGSVPEVFVGLYRSAMLRFVSFLHEVGHCIDFEFCNGTPLLTMEQRAWAIAWVLAEQHDVNVTAAAKLYAAECLKTYEPRRHLNHQESKGLHFNDDPRCVHL